MLDIKIDRSKFGQRFVAQFKGKYYYAMSLLVGYEDGRPPRQTGLDAAGNPSWIFRSAPRALHSFNSYTPGEWYNYPAGEKVLGVLLVREDGKTWRKGAA